MSDTAASLTRDQAATLAALADVIIPPSAEYGLPGAGDDAIAAEISSDAGRRRPRLQSALDTLNEMARKETSGDDGFAALDGARRAAVAEAFRSAHSADAEWIQNLAAQCYYRDDRVAASLGLELRPPHPIGYEVPDGDWTLLDPVRRRDPLYRRTEGAR